MGANLVCSSPEVALRVKPGEGDCSTTVPLIELGKSSICDFWMLFCHIDHLREVIFLSGQILERTRDSFLKTPWVIQN